MPAVAVAVETEREEAAVQSPAEILATLRGSVNVRDVAVGALDMVHKVAWWEIGLQKLRDLRALLLYAHLRPHTGRKRRPSVDVDYMVGKWVDVFVGLSTAHSHAEFTDADHETDEILLPMFSAPVAQIREFAQKLGARLESDERIPFMVWSGYRRVVEPVLLKAPDGDVLALKKHLAAEIAEMAEKGLDRAELVEAIAGALQWRPPESLEKVKTALAAGEKPRIKGRESCLFLEVGGERVVI